MKSLFFHSRIFFFLIVFSALTENKTIAHHELKNNNSNETVQDSILEKTTFYKTNVHASYYHDKFNGRKTASGQKYDNTKYTAAHKKLKFGTKVKVTNPKNGKFVVVTVNDRGPFVNGREIDLSKRAFNEIADGRKSGHLIVNLEIVK